MSMQCPDAAVAVPDFLSCCDLFSPGSSDWACGISEDLSADDWSMSCFGIEDVTQLDVTPPDDLALCLVPDIRELCPESSGAGDEVSAASDLDTLTPVSYGSLCETTEQNVLTDECDSSAQAAKAGSEAPESTPGSIVTCSPGTLPKLQLDYSNVLSAWEQMGGSVAVDAGVGAQPSVTLRLPPPEAGEALRALLPSYNLQDPSCTLPPPPPSVLDGPGFSGGLPMRMASLQSTGRCGSGHLAALPADDLLFGGDFSPRSFSAGGSGSVGDSDSASEELLAGALFDGCGLMPAIPGGVFGSAGSLAALGLSVLPQSLASIPAKTTECAKSARAACFVRYKEKKQNRKTGKIRYEMRKINAEKRPRIRGRFVKREELSMMLAAGEAVVSLCSAASSESSWL
jgi:hypothetical protein